MYQTADDKFLIIKNIKNFILNLESLLITFPKKDMYSKDRVYQDALELLEVITKANYEKRSEVKKTLQIEALAKVNKIDFYIERAYKLKYISERQAIKNLDILKNINKMIYAWCMNEKWYNT